MKHTFKLDGGHLNAEVTFDGEEIKACQEKAVNKLVANVTVPGFRKGHAPVSSAVRYLKDTDVSNETVNYLLRALDKNFEKDEEFSSYVKEQKFAARLHPSVSISKFTADEAVFSIIYFLKPSVSKLGEYKGLKAEVTEKSVTDKDVEAEIKKLAEDNAELVASDKASEMGDTVNIDFLGLMDGKPFDGGSANGFDLVLGSGRFVPGFEEQCVSHKAGDKFDVSVTMPDNYPAPLTSKPVVFKVTLNEVKTKEVPEINDEFATTLSGQYVAKDLAELKTKVKESLEKKAIDTLKRDTVNNLLLQVRNASEFVIAKEVLDDLIKDREASDEDNLLQQGLTLDEYLKLVNQTKEDYEANLKAGLENEIKSSLVINAIAEAEKLNDVKNEDLEKQLGQPLNKFVEGFSSYLKSSNIPENEISLRVNNYLTQVYSSIISANVQARVLELNSSSLAKKAADKVEKKETAEKKPAASKSTTAAKKTTTAKKTTKKEDKAE